MDKAKTLGLHYDKEVDVLYIYFDKPLEAVCIEEEEGLLIRVAPETSEVIGYTIIDFLARFDKLAQHAIQLPLAIDPATLDLKHDATQALERLYEQIAPKTLTSSVQGKFAEDL